MARPNVYDELVDRLRGLVGERAVEASPPVSRGKVIEVEPLVIELDDDVVVEEGDPDVEFDRAVLAERPEVGDTVRVHADGEDYIVSGVIE